MQVISYINAIKRQFRDTYGFKPLVGVGSKEEPIFGESQIPDGEYPMTIDDKLDHVRIVNGTISCCNFNKPKSTKKKKGIDLDKLQQETEKLLALLKDRQLGMMTWNGFLQERLTNLHELTSQALRK